jgi:hypothetical protein
MVHPTSSVGLLLAVLRRRVEPVRPERGASAIEWSIIAVVILGIVISVVAVLVGALDD